MTEEEIKEIMKKIIVTDRNRRVSAANRTDGDADDPLVSMATSLPLSLSRFLDDLVYRLKRDGFRIPRYVIVEIALREYYRLPPTGPIIELP